MLLRQVLTLTLYTRAKGPGNRALSHAGCRFWVQVRSHASPSLRVSVRATAHTNVWEGHQSAARAFKEQAEWQLVMIKAFLLPSEGGPAATLAQQQASFARDAAAVLDLLDTLASACLSGC